MPAPAVPRQRARAARRDPLSPDEIKRTLALLDSVSHALRAALTGRPIHGTDAAPIRVACARLGEILAKLAHGAES